MGRNGMEYSPAHPIGGEFGCGFCTKNGGGKESHKESTGCLVFRCFRFGVTQQKISFLISRHCPTRAFDLLSENHRRLSIPAVKGSVTEIGRHF